MLRRRHVSVKTVKELDAFPKVPELYVDKTAVGGTCKLGALFITCIRNLALCPFSPIIRE